MLLEICANSYQSAKNAQDAGAHRIELCQELSIGGITPSYGLLKKVLENLKIPVFVLIRPRGGNFVYSNNEFEVMKENIRLCKDLDCQGIVTGILKEDRTIDIKRTKELVELSRPLAFTFHRAFDEVINPKEALEQLIDIGIERVLTSGQKSTAEEGLKLLQDLNKTVKGKIIILAGGGINADNALKFKEAGLKEIHTSASKTVVQEYSMFGMAQTVSDINTVKSILETLEVEI